MECNKQFYLKKEDETNDAIGEVLSEEESNEISSLKKDIRKTVKYETVDGDKLLIKCPLKYESVDRSIFVGLKLKKKVDKNSRFLFSYTNGETIETDLVVPIEREHDTYGITFLQPRNGTRGFIISKHIAERKVYVYEYNNSVWKEISNSFMTLSEENIDEPISNDKIRDTFLFGSLEEDRVGIGIWCKSNRFLLIERDINDYNLESLKQSVFLNIDEIELKEDGILLISITDGKRYFLDKKGNLLYTGIFVGGDSIKSWEVVPATEDLRTKTLQDPSCFAVTVNGRLSINTDEEFITGRIATAVFFKKKIDEITRADMLLFDRDFFSQGAPTNIKQVAFSNFKEISGFDSYNAFFACIVYCITYDNEFKCYKVCISYREVDILELFSLSNVKYAATISNRRVAISSYDQGILYKDRLYLIDEESCSKVNVTKIEEKRWLNTHFSEEILTMY